MEPWQINLIVEGRRLRMEFIEQLVGISPDAGSGALELLFLFTPILAAGVFYPLRKRASNRPVPEPLRE